MFSIGPKNNLEVILKNEGEIKPEEVKRKEYLLQKEQRSEDEELELTLLIILENGMTREEIVTFISIASSYEIPQQHLSYFDTLQKKIQESLNKKTQPPTPE
uniref:Uncharacterized protein n=1 Tax=candidate division CPR3 bacterium TaxID=2268181 RepID=A0A7C4M5L3_UNCC3